MRCSPDQEQLRRSRRPEHECTCATASMWVPSVQRDGGTTLHRCPRLDGAITGANSCSLPLLFQPRGKGQAVALRCRSPRQRPQQRLVAQCRMQVGKPAEIPRVAAALASTATILSRHACGGEDGSAAGNEGPARKREKETRKGMACLRGTLLLSDFAGTVSRSTPAVRLSPQRQEAPRRWLPPGSPRATRTGPPSTPCGWRRCLPPLPPPCCPPPPAAGCGRPSPAPPAVVTCGGTGGRCEQPAALPCSRTTNRSALLTSTRTPHPPPPTHLH